MNPWQSNAHHDRHLPLIWLLDRAARRPRSLSISYSVKPASLTKLTWISASPADALTGASAFHLLLCCCDTMAIDARSAASSRTFRMMRFPKTHDMATVKVTGTSSNVLCFAVSQRPGTNEGVRRERTGAYRQIKRQLK